MIPLPVITAWRKKANWPLDEQVEQDLIISSTLVALFNNKNIKDSVVFRGGTALNKLIFPSPLRYSEDIDLNRMDSGPVKPLLLEIKNALKNILGTKRTVERTGYSVKLFYNFTDVSGGTRNLKIEINTREKPLNPVANTPFSVESDFFTGNTTLNVFETEEMIGTKIRALYQRRKGRDLFDLYKVNELGINWDNVIKYFKKLKVDPTKDSLMESLTQGEYLNNLDEKMNDSGFLDDMRPLLPSNVPYDIQKSYKWFCEEIIPRL